MTIEPRSSDPTALGPPERPPSAPRTYRITTLVIVMFVSSLLSIAGSWGITRSGLLASHAAHEPAGSELYVCPMHPTVVQDHPGDCPICGMQLVKSGPTAPAAGLSLVEIEPRRQQLIGLRTVAATRGSIGGAWKTVGRVVVDETRVRHVNLKIPGYVERIYVNYLGKKVNRGDPLFAIYSPELLSVQEEFLLALRTQGSLAKLGGAAGDGAGLVAAARRKLELWDIPKATIDQLAQSGVPTKTLTLYSPATGVVVKKDVVEGMKLDAGAMPYEIVDLSTVWVVADVYESELRFVKLDMAGTLTLAAYPNREFKGKVGFIAPLLEPQTRTVKVRLAFANPLGELRPEMFGEVVFAGMPHEGLLIPSDAVIDSGSEQIVFVTFGDGHFAPRQVKLGDGDGTQVEVLSGLSAGEQVVTRANFLIDSESRLRASLAELSGGPSPAAPMASGPESARVLPSVSAPDKSASAAQRAASPTGTVAPSVKAGHAR